MSEPSESSARPTSDPAGGGEVAEESSISRARVIALVAVCVLIPAGILIVALSRDGGDTTTVDASVAAAEGSLPEVGDLAPTFSLPGFDAGPVSVEDYRGRPLILTFFASWCHPCSEEIPHLNAALDDHADEDLAVVGVAFNDRDEDSIRFLEELEATWPAAPDPDGAVAAAYGIRAIPVTFFIGPDGTVVERGFGLTSEDALEAPLSALLAAA